MEKNQHNSARLVWTTISIAMTICIIIGLVLYAIFGSPSKDSPLYSAASAPGYHDTSLATNKEIDDNLSDLENVLIEAQQHKKDLDDLITVANVDGTDYYAEMTVEVMKNNAMAVIQSKLGLINSDKKELISLKDKINSADTIADIDKSVREFNKQFNKAVVPVVSAGVETYANNLKAIKKISGNVTNKIQTQVKVLKDCAESNTPDNDCENLEIEVRDNRAINTVQFRLDELNTMTNLMHKLLSVADQLIAEYSDLSEHASIDYLEGVATQLDSVLEMSVDIQNLLVATALSVREA